MSHVLDVLELFEHANQDGIVDGWGLLGLDSFSPISRPKMWRLEALK